MTDKQIIIDGVDVSGCEFYQIEANELYPKANYCGSMRNTFCEIEPDCYYKQLKRKEQECEELKEQLERADEDIKMKCTRCAMTNQLDEQLDQLKADLEQEKALKETYLTCYRAKHEDIEGELFKLKAENDELKKEIDTAKMNYKMELEFQLMYKQTFTEIKEIISKCCSSPNHTDCATYTQCIDCGRLSDEDGFQQILQKISEVLDG